jgi:hypothetical protein
VTPHQCKPGTVEYTALFYMAKGWDDDVVLRMIRKRHRKAKTTLGCIRWYRCHASNERLWM